MRIWALAALAVLTTANLQATEIETSNCVFPDPPELPDGSTASEELMGQASTAIRSYISDTELALDCLSATQETLGENISAEQQANLVTAYNAGVNGMTALVEKFNEQIRAYKAR